MRATEAAGRRDRLAIALLAYGTVGLALLALTLVLTLASLGAIERLARSVDATGPEGIGARLRPVELALGDAEDALAGFDATIVGTAEATVSGRALTGRLAETLRGLAASLDVTILGSRPFAGLGAGFLAVANDADALAADLEQTTGALAANRAALATLGDRIGELRAEVAGLRAELMAGEAASGGSAGDGSAGIMPAAEAFTLSRLVLVLLLGWLAVPPLVAAIVAVRRLRARARVTATD